MKQYLQLLDKIIQEGVHKGDRTGTGTLSIFGHQMRFNLADGFPLVTTKKVHVKAIIHELLWFLSGAQECSYLKRNGVTIWDEWADDNCSLGPIYGYQWRSWPTADGRHIDQLSQVIHQLKTMPNSRRMIVSAWNVGDLPDESISPQQNVANGKMALAPCHAFFQFYVAPSTGSGRAGKLSCQMYQRSCDTFLGVPFNIASYALLTHMVAEQCGLQVGDFIWTGGDVHLYLNHLDQAKLQLGRDPKILPKLVIKREPGTIFDYRYDDFEILDYYPHDHIKADISV